MPCRAAFCDVVGRPPPVSAPTGSPASLMALAGDRAAPWPLRPKESGSSAPEEVGFAVDSLLEGDGFEPSVPRQVFLAAPSIHAQFTFRNINRLARDRDRWFESISLQRRVRKLSVPRNRRRQIDRNRRYRAGTRGGGIFRVIRLRRRDQQGSTHIPTGRSASSIAARPGFGGRVVRRPQRDRVLGGALFAGRGDAERP